MDPHDKQRKQLQPRKNPYLGDSQSDNSGNDQTPDNPGRNAADSGNPQAADRQPHYSDGFTMIPPNESRRSKMKMMAQKEEEDLQRWKETHRVASVHVNPEKLGGNVTLAEAREKQRADLHCSKLQKKLKQEEENKRRKQEEEEKIQQMKAEQRAKAERLEEKKQQEEQRRREQLQQDYLRKTETFLQRFERRAPGPLASYSATHTSSTSEALERKPEKSEREVQLEHQRVNSAWLDKLEARARGSEREGVREALEDFRHRASTSTGQNAPLAHLKPDPEQICSSWTEEADMEPDFDWALMKLMNSFPDCSKVFLEDILNQCNGDYDQAYMLLLS